MPNGLRNWNYKQLIKFLEEKGFIFGKELPGSHETWVNKETDAVVNVNYTKKTYPIRTLETMIRQSKIAKTIWRKFK